MRRDPLGYEKLGRPGSENYEKSGWGYEKYAWGYEKFARGYEKFGLAVFLFILLHNELLRSTPGAMRSSLVPLRKTISPPLGPVLEFCGDPPMRLSPGVG